MARGAGAARQGLCRPPDRPVAAGRASADPASEVAALAALRSDSPRQRWEAAAVLARNSQRSETAMAALVAALADPEPFVRWQAAEALAGQEAGRVFPVLSAALADADPRRRAGAAEALGRVGGEAACMALCKRVSDPDLQVRVAVARASERLWRSDHRAGPAAPCWPTRTRMCVAPRPLPYRAPAPRPRPRRWQRPCKRQANRCSSAAAWRLRFSAPRTPPPSLPCSSALADPDPQVRGYAAQALGQIGDEAAHTALLAVAGDQTALLTGTVGDAVRSALATCWSAEAAAACCLVAPWRRGHDPRTADRFTATHAILHRRRGARASDQRWRLLGRRRRRVWPDPEGVVGRRSCRRTRSIACRWSYAHC